MLTTLIVCLSLVCHSRGVFIKEECDPYSSSEETQKPLTDYDLQEGQIAVASRVSSLQEEIDNLVPIILLNSANKDLAGMARSIVQFLDNGMAFYKDMLYGTVDTGRRMMEGDYSFKKSRKCRALRSRLRSPDESNEMSETAIAIAKDLQCFYNRLSETFTFNQHDVLSTGCYNSDSNVMDFITNSVRALFRFRNDGDRFFQEIVEVAQLNGTDLLDHFLGEFNGTDGIYAQQYIKDFDKV